MNCITLPYFTKKGKNHAKKRYKQCFWSLVCLAVPPSAIKLLQPKHRRTHRRRFVIIVYRKVRKEAKTCDFRGFLSFSKKCLWLIFFFTFIIYRLFNVYKSVVQPFCDPKVGTTDIENFILEIYKLINVHCKFSEVSGSNPIKRRSGSEVGQRGPAIWPVTFLCYC